MVRSCISVLLVLIGLYHANAQSAVDSLKHAFKNTSVDSVKVRILFQLYDEHQYESPEQAKITIKQAIELAKKTNAKELHVLALNQYADLLAGQAKQDTAIIVYNKALDLAEKIGNNNGKSMALIGLGNSYWRQGNLEKAKGYQELNIQLSESINDQEGIASSYNNMGNIYNEMGEYAKAMEYYTLASKKNIAIGNIRNSGVALANIGLIHQKLENYDNAITYYGRSDSIFKEIQFHPGRAFVLKNLAIVYRNTEDFERSIAYNIKALKSYEQMGQLREIGQIHSVMGNIFWDKENFQKALLHYQKYYDIAFKTTDSINLGMASQTLGSIHHRINNLEEAQKHAQQAVAIATAIDIKLTAMDAYETLAEVYYDQSNFNMAYQSLYAYMTLRDSLYTIEKRDLAADIEGKYQNEQKSREIALLESKNEVQTLQIAKRETERNYLIAFAVSALVLIGLGYNQYRIKQKANAKLKELDHLKSDFFANISHEFRTPLSLLLGPLKEKITTARDIKEQQEYQMMYRNADRLFQLINQLLELSKLESGKLTLQYSTVEVNKFFKILAASFSSLAEYKNINFYCKLPTSDTWVAFDKDVLEKTCNNLLSNAFKFTPEGGKVTLQVFIKDSALYIAVSDTGAGIDSSDRSKIFDRFYQSSEVRQLGTGIGLALTRQLIELHGGKIELESSPGQGSVFTISIPVKEVEPLHESEGVTIHVAGEVEKIAAIDTTNEQPEAPVVLIIEDNPDLQNYLSQLMKSQYTIHKSNDGIEGIKKAKEIIPDLIISDVMMPGKNGMEVCSEIKSTMETNHIPVILLTARADQESKLQGLTTGADIYLQKPFDPKELVVVVANLLQQRAQLKEKYEKLLLLAPEEIEISSDQEVFLKKVMEIVNLHLDNPNFTAELFCEECGMSRMQLHRKLSALTGYSTTAFIRHQRILRATQLLDSGITVSEVAYATGFGSLSYFTTIFKKEKGMTPSSYASQRT